MGKPNVTIEKIRGEEARCGADDSDAGGHEYQAKNVTATLKTRNASGASQNPVSDARLEYIATGERRSQKRAVVMK